MKTVATLISILSRWSPKVLYEIIRRRIGASVPFARTLGIELETLSDGRASARLPEDRQLLNHVGTVHAGALFSLCDSASGAAMAGAMSNIITQTSLVVRSAQVQYLRPATGQVVAHAKLSEDVNTVRSKLNQNGRADVVVEVKAVLESPGGDIDYVAMADFTWHIRVKAN